MKNTLLYLLIAISATACVKNVFNEEGSYKNPPLPHEVGNKKIDMFKKVNKAAYIATDKLFAQAPYLKPTSKPVLFTSFTKLSDGGDSAFGLMVSQEMMSRLTQLEFPVVNQLVRLGKHSSKTSPSSLLHRNKNLAGAIVFGDYAVGAESVFISTRLVRPDDNRVLASYDFSIKLSEDAKKLLRTRE